MLRPCHAAFGPAALCLRCLLDELLQRLPAPAPRQPCCADGVDDEVDGCAGAAERGVVLEGELDARFLQLCCPGLEAARQALQRVRCLSQRPALVEQVQLHPTSSMHAILKDGLCIQLAATAGPCLHCVFALPPDMQGTVAWTLSRCCAGRQRADSKSRPVRQEGRAQDHAGLAAASSCRAALLRSSRTACAC